MSPYSSVYFVVQRVKIVINDNIIEQVTDFKYLGYRISESMDITSIILIVALAVCLFLIVMKVWADPSGLAV